MHQVMWSETQLPVEMVSLIEKELSKYDEQQEPGKVSDSAKANKNIRDSSIYWLNENNWICGFLMHYVNIHNRDNYGYDLHGLDSNVIQYSRYGPGGFYTWHTDVAGPQMPLRKLSFTLQLSDPSEYEGGELQFIDNNRNSFFAPKDLGTLITFKSDMLHRVRPVKSGVRKSIVGWMCGPPWK